MDLSALAGNSQLKQQLERRRDGRELNHAYLIAGPRGSGRHTLAELLIRAAVCQGEEQKRPCGHCPACRKALAGIHPDISRISGADQKPISVDQVRQLRSDAYIRPNEAQRKIYLLEQVDSMNASAQNAMLKLLEDGPAYGMFLLLAENPGGVLLTIRSRCELLSLTPMDSGELLRWLHQRYPQREQEELSQAVLHAQGLPGRAVEALEGKNQGELALGQLARKLAQAMEEGDELALFQAAMPLEKLGREELCLLLERLLDELGALLPHSVQKSRLWKGTELVRELRSAAQLNGNPGQLSGWLCAGIFS